VYRYTYHTDPGKQAKQELLTAPDITVLPG